MDYSLFLQRDRICLEEAFVPSAIRPSSLQGRLGEPASWSSAPHGQIPPAQAGPLRYSHASGLPAALMRQGLVPIAPQSRPPGHPAPQKASWRLQGRGAAG